MIFAHPDAAVRAYAAAIERSGALSRCVVSHGREYQTRCERKECRKARSRARARSRRNGEPNPADWVEVYSSQTREITTRCAFCLQNRQWVNAYILGGQGGGGRKGRAPGAMIRSGDLAPLSIEIEGLVNDPGLSAAQAEAYIRHVATGKSYDLTACDLSERRVGDRHWTADQVEQAVRKARSALRRRLERKGMIEWKPENRGWKRGRAA